eukprot:2253787-Prymnesium_polylepis.3
MISLAGHSPAYSLSIRLWGQNPYEAPNYFLAEQLRSALGVSALSPGIHRTTDDTYNVVLLEERVHCA